jgi:hypothetical protein
MSSEQQEALGACRGMCFGYMLVFAVLVVAGALALLCAAVI